MTPVPVRDPSVPFVTVERYDMNSAHGMIISAVHEYEGYAIENGTADEYPKTPQFIAVATRKTSTNQVEFERSEQEK